ncbi:MAG TPA: NTP transferase domain-containing protein [Bacteroidales bacterium]|jgi:dTDP-glucose pyrophosphorylase|nr:NTP transferase domain-containing protein [Bacteroidales bacterium]OQB64822.1 MAG: MobA-like NTP transferase domain protein [Bacteroidetes bacterium ADurb.Bin145]NMD03499.1 NTP transferase domain-containing protein [Bacteroidales bacterium]HOU03047.1 NTP transferase domain-containing protein [Bacteroidales bacterium]HQG63873.1 NTP transferase domain-containing protein [Bacteroidales bacterium]
MKPSILVLAAGMGSRYGGNKQLDEVGPAGETIIDYSIYDAIRAGFGKIVFVIRRDIEDQVKERFVEKLQGKIEVDYVFQEITNLPEGVKVSPERAKPWGTSHAILVTENKIKEPFGVINADDYYGVESFRILYDFLTNDKDPDCYSIVGYKLGNTLSDHGHVNRGVCKVGQDGLLQHIVETRQIEKINGGAKAPGPDGHDLLFTGNEIVSMNLFGFKPSCYDYLRKEFREFINNKGMDLKAELDIPTSLDKFVKNGTIRIKVLMSNEKWFGVTYREDKPHVVENIKKMIRRGVYPARIY